MQIKTKTKTKTKNYQHQPFVKLIQFLKKLCNDKKNGMLFIISDTRQSSHILLIDGIISHITFGTYEGEKALFLLKKIKTCRFHFSEGNKKDPQKLRTEQSTNEEIFHKLTSQVPYTKKSKILIVDDSTFVRKQVVGILSGQYLVYEATNGLEAVSSLARIKPDLILLDLIMPEMDGYEVLNTIKKNTGYADIPILFLTSRDTLLDKIKGKISKSDAYITKPFKAEDLLKDIHFHLLRHQNNTL